MDSSQFTENRPQFESFEQMDTRGATCDTFRVKLYGKLHFLKRLKADYVGDIRYREALRKEFETGYRLEHPNLVRYISLDDDSILMEYVDGETLSQRLAEHPEYFRNRKNTDKFVRQLLSAVGYLHAHQVLHLDLKPDNILLTRIGDDLKIIDLGFCYTDTFPDTTGHTNIFAAPEQLAGGTVDTRSDIYAIGKILELLPGRHIYNKVIGRCTAADPAERYWSAEELQQTIFARRHFSSYILLSAVLLLIVGILLFSFRFLGLPSTSVATANETVSDSSNLQRPTADPQPPLPQRQQRVAPSTESPKPEISEPMPETSAPSQLPTEEPDTTETSAEEQDPAEPAPAVSRTESEDLQSPQIAGGESKVPAEVQFQPIRKEITAEEKTLLDDPRLRTVNEEEFRRYKKQLDEYMSKARKFVEDKSSTSKFPGHIDYDNEYSRIKRICLDNMKADQWFWSLYNSPMNPVSSYTRKYMSELDRQQFLISCDLK